MFETFLKTAIDELGATGILVCGLYLLLYRPLTKIATHIQNINDELAELLKWLKEKKPKVEDTHG